MIDTMTLPYSGHYGTPQAENHYLADGLLQTYPYKIQTQEALQRGRLSYWNPYILGGYPQYAETMANNYDPLNFLLLIFSAADTILIQTLLELLIAGFGMVLLLKHFKISPMIAAIFSSAYMLNSLFITNAEYRWIIAAFCWMPYSVLMIFRYFDGNGRKNLYFTAIFLALSFLGGNFQTSFFAAIIVAVLFFFSPSANPKSLAKRILLLIVVGVWSFALSAFMWLPVGELFYTVLFHGGSLNSSSVYQGYSIVQRLLSIPLLSIFFFPGLAGGPQIFGLKNIAGADVINFNGALTFLPTLFGVWGCFSFWKNRELRPFIILAILSIASPIFTPLYSVLYHRYFIVASFSLSVIGAVMFQQFIGSETFRNARRNIVNRINIVFASFIIGLVGICTAVIFFHDTLSQKLTTMVTSKIKESSFGIGNESWMTGRVEKTLHYYSLWSLELWIPIVAAIPILVAIRLYYKNSISQKRLLLIVCVSTSIQLLVFIWSWFPLLDKTTFPIYPTNSIVNFLQTHSADTRYVVWADDRVDKMILVANSANIFHISDLHAFESLTPASMSVFYKRHVPKDSINLRLLGLASVKYIVTKSRSIASSDAKLVFEDGGMHIYENSFYKPRFYFASNATVVKSDTLLYSGLLDTSNLGASLLLNEGDSILHGDYTNAHLTVEKSEPENILISMRTDSVCYLIFTDTYYPGWKCYVNDIETKIYRANYAQQAIIVPAGNAKVEFQFQPATFALGMQITFSSIIGCIIALLSQRSKKTKA